MKLNKLIAAHRPKPAEGFEKVEPISVDEAEELLGPQTLLPRAEHIRYTKRTVVEDGVWVTHPQIEMHEFQLCLCCGGTREVPNSVTGTSPCESCDKDDDGNPSGLWHARAFNRRVYPNQGKVISDAVPLTNEAAIAFEAIRGANQAPDVSIQFIQAEAMGVSLATFLYIQSVADTEKRDILLVRDELQATADAAKISLDQHVLNLQS